MRVRLVVACTALLLAFTVQAYAGDFTDDGGRKVKLPDHVSKAFPAGPPASAFLYMVAPDMLPGTTQGFSPAQKPFVPPAYADLPALGRLTGRGNTVNLENLLKIKPDLVVDVGTIAPTYVSLADRVQEQTGIPYVLLGGALADSVKTFRDLGTILGAKDKAEPLAQHAQETLDLVKKGVAAVPAAQRPKIYLARGPKGLVSGGAGSINMEAIDVLGAHNVAADNLGPGGLMDVSMEQVVAWQPDVIVTVDPGFYKSVWTDPLWQQVKAVKDKRVYLSPSQPFAWVDDPPAANRLIGLRWLGKVIYPQQFAADLGPEIKRFYGLFYHQQPTDEQVAALAASAQPGK